MAEKITYILGAGASIGAFPLVKGTKEWSDKGLADILFEEGVDMRKLYTASSDLSIDHSETAKKIAFALSETGHNAKEFGNVDSYAKYLYHTGKREKLKDLKIALSYYFVRRLACNGHVKRNHEKRYLNFITAIINDQHRFPDHVKILSWNYDFLLEGAFNIYQKEEFSEGNGVAHRTPAFTEYFPHSGYEAILTNKEFAKQNFSVVHLNGIAGFYVDKNTSGSKVFKSIFLDILQSTQRTIDEKELIKLFHQKHLEKSHLITFAWEKKTEEKGHLVNSARITEEMIKGTTALVVIGYSFPFYNREVDNMIFETITPTLKKIYFQDPHVNGGFLRKRYTLRTLQEAKEELEINFPGNDFMEIPYVDIEHISYTDQFYVPIEL